MWIDIGLAIIIMGCIGWGIIKGGIREIFGIIGIIIGILGGARFYIRLATALPIRNWLIAKPISFIILFVVIASSIYLIGFLIYKLMHFIGVGFLDRILGVIFGGIKGSLIAGIICFFIALFPKGENIIQHSKLAPIVFRELRILRAIFPKELRRKIKWRTPREHLRKTQERQII